MSSDAIPQHHWRRPRVVPVAVLTVIWVLLWSDLSWGNLVAGIALGIVISAALPLPPISARVRPMPLVRLVGHFVADLVVASAQVAWLAVRPAPLPPSSVIAVPLRARSDLVITIIADLVSLVPGTVVIQVTDSRLYLHALGVSDASGIERARRSVRQVEQRVAQAFGNADDLTAVTHPTIGQAP